jgi:hypothetical protein
VLLFDLKLSSEPMVRRRRRVIVHVVATSPPDAAG